MEYIKNSIIHRCKHPFVIGIFILYTLFILAQLQEIKYYPLKEKNDIYELANLGETSYILKDFSPEVLKEIVKDNIDKQINDSNTTLNNRKILETIKEQLENKGLDELKKEYEGTEIYIWIDSFIANAKNQFKSVDEINETVMAENYNYGYQIELQKKYLTYSQAIWAFLIIAYTYFFIKDNNGKEIIETKRIGINNGFKYYLYDITVMMIPCVLYVYLFGLVLNLYSFFRFKNAGYDILYKFTINRFVTSFVPTIMMCIAILMFIYRVFENNYGIAMPLYLVWMIFNVTPTIFSAPKIINGLIVLERLDGLDTFSLSHRIIILVTAIVLLIISFYSRKGKRFG